MAKYRANFFDKNSDEFRAITVEADTEKQAEEKATQEADRRGWPDNFKLGDVEET